MTKILHYCWFGGGNKPRQIQRCIRSWRKVSGYRIIEWNESNFDIRINEFVRTAYRLKKYAFVSDYCRIWALYNHGGIYLDTDIFLYKDIGKRLKSPFACFERPGVIQTAAMSSNKHDPLLKKVLDVYDGANFDFSNGKANLYIGDVFTSVLSKVGNTKGNSTRMIGPYHVYRNEVFFPLRWNWHVAGGYYKSKDTVGEHLFYGSWARPAKCKLKTRIYKCFCAVFGTRAVDRLAGKLAKKSVAE